MIWCGMFRNFIFFLEYMHFELKEDFVVLNGRECCGCLLVPPGATSERLRH